MIMTLKRSYINEQKGYCIGHLFLNNVYFCDTLEDIPREIDEHGKGKIYGKTAIPKGEYKVVLSKSPKFGITLPRLQNVPHFSGILMHYGNTVEDTEGCILCGENKIKGMVINSRNTIKKLVDELEKYKKIKIIIE